MASKAELVQYIADQCSGAGAIRTLKMFGDYGIYCDGKIFGLICDNQLFIKITKAGKPANKKSSPKQDLTTENFAGSR